MPRKKAAEIAETVAANESSRQSTDRCVHASTPECTSRPLTPAISHRMGDGAQRAAEGQKPSARSSALVDTRVIYCGDNLEQLRKLPNACLDLIYLDPPFNSNRNYEVFWGETIALVECKGRPKTELLDFN